MDTVIIVAIVSSSALSAIISGMFGLIKKRGGVAAGVRQLLYDRIKYLGRCYIEAKEISSEDLEDIIKMHQIYHDDLNGNGYLDRLMAAVKLLPIVK